MTNMAECAPGDDLDKIVLAGFVDAESVLKGLQARSLRDFEIRAAIGRATTRGLRIADLLGAAANRHEIQPKRVAAIHQPERHGPTEFT